MITFYLGDLILLANLEHDFQRQLVTTIACGELNRSRLSAPGCYPDRTVGAVDPAGSIAVYR